MPARQDHGQHPSSPPHGCAQPPWDRFFDLIHRHLRDVPLPSVSDLARSDRDPFHVLVSTMISLRTKDEVTATAAARLLSEAPTVHDLAALSVVRIEQLIYPAGFYHTKARHLREMATILLERHGSKVPSSIDLLLKLPGVGRKTANLVLNLGFGVPAICVDTHVHRISNRLGWVESATPAHTEQTLMERLPRRYWMPVNELLVGFGKKTCTPLSPWCSRCPLADFCPRVGVERSR